MKIIISCFLVSILSLNLFAQTDTTLNLNEIIIKGFENSKRNLNVPASVSSIKAAEIQRYNNASILPIFNEQTGVRIEERSPGSYRVSVRGSSIRSPFGVRNVKIYLNDIPFSDANGTTYFNQIDLNALGNIEILKGPSSSIYGAGYGGVLRLDYKKPKLGSQFSSGFHIGTWGTFNHNYAFDHNSKKIAFSVHHSQIGSDGYREHSASNGNRTSFQFSYYIAPKHTLKYTQLTSKIDYKTPGGLTLAQMEANRKASRPAAGANPGAKEQNSSISQNLNLSGLTHNFAINSKSELKTSVFWVKSKLQNPFITSFEDRNETTFGYRSIYNTSFEMLEFTAGIEGIFTDSEFDVKQNNSGKPGNFLYNTKLKSSQLTHFAQASYPLPWQLELTGGLSYNFQNYNNKTIGSETVDANEKIGIPVTPRLAILKKIDFKTSAFYSFSNGYSSPTAQEMTANFENSKNIKLKAEIGSSHEFGLKRFWNPNFKSELAVYHQNVNKALIRNVLENGNEFFENTGNIIQKGIELSNQAKINFSNAFINQVNVSANLTINDFTFGEYINEGKNLKGFTLPGTSKVNSYLAFQIQQKNGFYLNADANYLSKTPLNSQNTVWAESTLLSSSRLGWQKTLFQKLNLNIYSGIENIFNEKYSLGYDFNAFGNRFYNPAPTRSLNAGLKINYKI